MVEAKGDSHGKLEAVGPVRAPYKTRGEILRANIAYLNVRVSGGETLLSAARKLFEEIHSDPPRAVTGHSFHTIMRTRTPRLTE